MYVKNMLFKGMEERHMVGDKMEDGDAEEGESRGEWSSGIMVENLEKEIKDIIKEGGKAAAGIDIVGLQGAMTESKYTLESAAARIIVIIFIMFIAGIRRRKGRGIEIEGKRERKTRISA
jgi:hypothetical protein